MNELDTTGVPLPFECAAAYRVQDSRLVERALHDAFGMFRVRPNREFFEVPVTNVVAILRLMGEEVEFKENHDAETEHSMEKARTRRGNFNFAMLQIPAGAILSMDTSYGDGITCEVVNAKEVKFRGEVLRLSPATAKALNKKEGSGVQGALYWYYEGETLAERRSRMEDSD